MKIRQGFVSNSSSSSFVIDLDNISAKQLEKIKNHFDYRKVLNMDWADEMDPSDTWEISVDEEGVHGWTSMDNFDMAEFLEKIGVDSEDINWGD